ncbi:hypothetical protein GCM10020000_74790 [Streptomyces olivoverticillatus]
MTTFTPVALGTKAESLARLAPQVTCARILPLAYFTLRDWRTRPTRLLQEVLQQPWAGGALIVRSSALAEDSATGSQAGRFTSLATWRGHRQLHSAVEEVFASYDDQHPGNQVLIQPQLAGVVASGVATSCDPSSGAPYAVVNFSENERTDAVTGGREGNLRLAYGAAYDPGTVPPTLLVGRVWELLGELADLTGQDHLDIEFAQTGDGELFLFQARPLACPPPRHPRRIPPRHTGSAPPAPWPPPRLAPRPASWARRRCSG